VVVLVAAGGFLPTAYTSFLHDEDKATPTFSMQLPKRRFAGGTSAVVEQVENIIMNSGCWRPQLCRIQLIELLRAHYNATFS